MMDIIALNNKVLFNYINSCSSNQKKNLLSDLEVKKKLILADDDYPFIWLVQSLNKEELGIFLDDKGINVLINSKNISHKLNALMNLDNNVNCDVLSKPKIIQKIIDNKQELSTYLVSTDIIFIESLFNYINNNELDFNIILSCKRNLYKFFDNMKNMEIVKQKNLINKDNLHLVEQTALELLLNDSYFQNIILSDDYSLNDFDKIILDETKFPDDLLRNKKFINKIINNREVSNYRFLLERLSKNNNISLVSDIDVMRNEYYDNLISSYDENLQIFDKYRIIINSIFNDGKIVNQDEFFELDINKMLSYDIGYEINIIYFNRNLKDKEKYDKIESVLINLTNKEFNDILIDRFFKEVPYNFLLNLNTLIDFNLKNNVIEKDNLKKYIEIKENNKFDRNLYESFDKSKDYVSIFYDDFKTSKNCSYGLLNDSLVDIDKIKGQQNVNLSMIHNVPIYEFNGEPFYLLIHNTSQMVTDGLVPESIFHENRKNDGISLSLISNNKMDYYNDYMKSIVFGFDKINIEQIIHLYNSDSFSFYKLDSDKVSNRITKLYTPENLINDTDGYNEIVYQEKTKNTEFLNPKELRPSYLVVFDEITNAEIMVAKEYNIPIIKIDRSKYKRKNNNKSIKGLLNNGDSYVNSYFELKNKSR